MLNTRTLASIEILYFFVLVCVAATMQAMLSLNEWYYLAILLLAFLRVGLIAFVGILSAALVLAFGYLDVTASIVLLSVITIVSSYIGWCYQEYYYATTVTMLFSLISMAMPVGQAVALSHANQIIVATVVVLLVRWLHLPWLLKGRTRSLLLYAVTMLEEFQKKLFFCLLQADYPESIYLYERRLHRVKIAFMNGMAQLRQLMNHPRLHMKEKEWVAREASQLEELYALLQESAMVRWRIDDWSVFALCSSELSEVSAALSRLFSSMYKVLKDQQVEVDVAPLRQALSGLDDAYHNVLQVTAPEPLVITLFLDSLRLLAESAMQIRESNDD